MGSYSSVATAMQLMGVVTTTATSSIEFLPMQTQILSKFVPSTIGGLECSICGFRANHPKEHNCLSTKCTHLGNYLRTEGCTNCPGNVHLKVYACKVYNECTLGKSTGSIHSCEGCEDFTSTL